MKEENIKTYSLEEILKMPRGLTRPDAPEYPLPEDFWDNAELIDPRQPPKKSIHLRVDDDVLNWFKSQGPGHLTRMQAVLRSYFEAQRKK